VPGFVEKLTANYRFTARRCVLSVDVRREEVA
jgi:hypothetical protein